MMLCVDPKESKNRILQIHKMRSFLKSGRWDSNPGPLTPHASALAGLRHAPISGLIIAAFIGFGKRNLIISELVGKEFLRKKKVQPVVLQAF